MGTGTVPPVSCQSCISCQIKKILQSHNTNTGVQTAAFTGVVVYLSWYHKYKHWFSGIVVEEQV